MVLNQFVERAIKSAVNGASGAITVAIVDPDHFSMASAGGWKKLAVVVLVGALVREALFLKTWSEAPDTADTKGKTQ
jgi:hypothetical protein